MSDYPRMAFLGAVLCLALAVGAVLLFAFAPLLIGENQTLDMLLPIIGMLLVVAAGLMALVGMLLYIYEIATAKNNGQWKAIWIIAIAVLGLIGVVIYEIAARKERKA